MDTWRHCNWSVVARHQSVPEHRAQLNMEMSTQNKEKLVGQVNVAPKTSSREPDFDWTLAMSKRSRQVIKNSDHMSTCGTVQVA
jgi:hypothetical protein